jgi:serine/threonine protein kinase
MAENLIGLKLLGPNEEFFEIKKFLGKGSFGKVFRVVGEESNRVAALKLALTGDESDSPSFALRSLTNEIKHAMLEISHPNVVSYLYVNEDGNDELGPYVIMEFIEGGTLLDFLTDRKKIGTEIPLEDAISLMRGIALGAEAINEKLIHRDIKPDNIMLDGKENNFVPRIADFGISKIALDPTRPETFKGIQSVLYMAPEVWNQQKNTFKVDVYSVGLVFYEILTLRHPLLEQVEDPSNFLDWREAHLNKLCPDVRQVRADVPAPISRILLRMTDKYAANRPNWEEILASLNFEKPKNAPAELDPEVLAAFTKQADEQFRAKQAQTEAELKEAERQNLRLLRREEYNQAFVRLVEGFDQIIEALNQQLPDAKVTISGAHSDRSYTMPNSRIVSCVNFGYAPNGQGSVLGGGFMGVNGGLSANLVFHGSHENISEGYWSAIQVTMPLIGSGQRRLELYQRAGINDETIRYVENMDYDKPWRRDLPGFFAIKNSELFFSRVGFSGMDVYQLVTADVSKTFNQILKVALKMPAIN